MTLQIVPEQSDYRSLLDAIIPALHSDRKREKKYPRPIILLGRNNKQNSLNLFLPDHIERLLGICSFPGRRPSISLYFCSPVAAAPVHPFLSQLDLALPISQYMSPSG